MSELSPDASLFDAGTNPPPQDPPLQDPPTQDPIAAPPSAPWDQILGAINSIGDRLVARQDAATSANAQPAMPATWWDSLNDAQQKAINDQALLNAGQTNAFIAQQESEFARRKTIQDAAPIIAAQASTFVELYKARKARQQYYDQIEPLFDKMLAGIDLRPLVNMSPQTRESELDMRWNSARAQVQDKILANPPKREPLLTTGGGPAPLEAPTVENDDWLSAMSGTYGFTEEQKRALAEAKD